MSRSLVELALLVLLGVCSCKPSAKGSPTTALTAAGASALPPPAITALREKPAPWYGGRWSGSYLAQKHDPLFGTNEGQQLVWIKDKGESFVGPGRLELAIDDEGNISGSASGVLGNSVARGRVSDKFVHFTLLPSAEKDRAFAGTASGTLKEQRIELDLRLASADGSLIRLAAAILNKSGPK